METKHRKGDFLVNTERDWILVSGAQCKFDTLSVVAREVGFKSNISQLKSPPGIDEKNHYKSSRFIYLDKADQIWEATRGELGTAVGIMNDVHPKIKRHQDHQYLIPLVKFPQLATDTPIDKLRYQVRKSLLASYIYECFGIFGSDEAVDVRQSTGVVPFFATAMIGLIIQKSYVHYPTNPFPSVEAATNYLDFAEENNVDSSGVFDNSRLLTSARAAGGILHKTLLEWYVQDRKNEKVIVDTHTDDPLVEIDRIGSGFTESNVLALDNLSRRYEPPKQLVQNLLVREPIILSARHTTEVVWSSDEKIGLTKLA